MISEYMKSQLAKVGITLNIEQIEFATWLDQVYHGVMRDHDGAAH